MSDLPWLSLVYESGRTTVLEQRTAYENLLSAPRNGVAQIPALVTFVGQQNKSLWLTGLLNVPSAGVQGSHGQIRLHATRRDRRNSSPIIYVDCELHSTTSIQRPGSAPYDSYERRLRWMDGTPTMRLLRLKRMIAQKIYTRVLSPFVSINCLFGADLGGLTGASGFLAEQAAYSPGPDLPQITLPRVLLILGSNVLYEGRFREHAQARDQAKFIQLTLQGIKRRKRLHTQREAQHVLDSHFRDLDVYYVHDSICTSEQLRAVEDIITLKVREIERYRALEQVLFTYPHLQAFLTSGLDQFALGHDAQISLVLASRTRNPPSVELATHASALLATVRSSELAFQHSIRMMAAALILDSCPPDMHYFPASAVFRQFYFTPCFTAIGSYTSYAVTQSTFMNQLEDEYEVQYSTIASKPQICTAAESHLGILRDLRSLRHHLPRSHRTCWCCLMRMPEKILSCGHALCDTCIRIFGVRTATSQHDFRIKSCPLCGSMNATSIFQLIPPTAGIRMLSIDGGGVRGVIPLTMLKCIEHEVAALGLPLRDFFDLTCGTSSGGLVVLGMFLRAWSPTQCLEMFETMSRKIFKRRTNGSMLFSRAQDLIMSYLADCRYNTDEIEEALQQSFGTHVSMFNPLTTDTKVAVTSTTAKDAEPCIFSNYNGQSRDQSKNYNIIRAMSAEHDATIAEAARCTSAAPWFFSPKSLLNLGTFQDGALRHNNPINIAMREHGFIWPMKDKPDFVLSLGTGTPSRSRNGSRSSPVRDRFFQRLFRSFMLSMEGEKIWDEFYETLPQPSQTRYHRLNIELDSSRLGIDDVSSIKKLEEDAERYMDSATLIGSLRDAMYASMFYFELDRKPDVEHRQVVCTGHILLRLRIPSTGRRVLYHQLLAASAFFTIGAQCIPCIERSPDIPPPYRRSVRFTLESVDDDIDIKLNAVTRQPVTISGLPRRAVHLADAQLLDCPFGRADHSRCEKRLPLIPGNKRKAEKIA